MRIPTAASRCPAIGKTVQRIPTVCVVDPREEDYRDWDAIVQAGGVRLASVATAAKALRLSRTQQIDLWVVNAELSGLSGYELCKMLKAQSPNAAVYVVTDEYTADRELQAFRAGATLYSCKPGHRELLSQWLAVRRAIATC